MFSKPVVFEKAPLFASLMIVLAACGSGSCGGGGTRTVVTTPMCTILAGTFMDNPKLTSYSVGERTDPNVDHGFVFRSLGGPRGNFTLGFTQDIFGISEAWLRNPVAPEGTAGTGDTRAAHGGRHHRFQSQRLDHRRPG